MSVEVGDNGLVETVGGNDFIVSGRLTVVGAASLPGGVETSGGISTTAGGAQITGSTGISGNTDIAGNLLLVGNLLFDGDLVHSGSVVNETGAVVQITANSDAGAYTQVNVSGRYIVPLSGSSVSASAGFAPTNMTEGQSVIFLNVAAKPVIMAGFGDASTPVISLGSALQCIYYGSTWYHMSGTH